MSSQLELWAEELGQVDTATDMSKVEHYLTVHNDSVMHMQNCVFEVLQRGQDLCQVRKKGGFMAPMHRENGPKNSCQCQGKHREFGNDANTQGILYAQVVNTLNLKVIL